MLETIRKAWGWIGLEPAEVISSNPFGNVIVRATDNKYWRICPEEWSCEIIAQDLTEFAKLPNDDDFRTDWEMARLVKIAANRLGPITDDQCYCLKRPGIIGGEYSEANLGTISRLELISFSGDMAHQIKDLPDGAQIQFESAP